ncbi:unnamed protein product [Heterobilharzia americana]|nr:unnamed protein product [Heterobilharzia americana]
MVSRKMTCTTKDKIIRQWHLTCFTSVTYISVVNVYLIVYLFCKQNSKQTCTLNLEKSKTPSLLSMEEEQLIKSLERLNKRLNDILIRQKK